MSDPVWWSLESIQEVRELNEAFADDTISLKACKTILKKSVARHSPACKHTCHEACSFFLQAKQHWLTKYNMLQNHDTMAKIFLFQVYEYIAAGLYYHCALGGAEWDTHTKYVQNIKKAVFALERYASAYPVVLHPFLVIEPPKNGRLLVVTAPVETLDVDAHKTYRSGYKKIKRANTYERCVIAYATAKTMDMLSSLAGQLDYYFGGKETEGRRHVKTYVMRIKEMARDLGETFTSKPKPSSVTVYVNRQGPMYFSDAIAIYQYFAGKPYIKMHLLQDVPHSKML